MIDSLLADRTKRMGTNAIREMLKVGSQPGMISLAGGNPAPESFPMEIIRELTLMVIEKYATRAFQYDPTEGFPPLREALSTHLRENGIDAASDEILISTGSQGVLDAIGMALITKGDKIAIEAPTYVGALQAFTPYEPEYIRMDTDDDGLVPDALEAVLQREQVKFIYLIPTFQNPSGRTIPNARRKEIASIVRKYNRILIEDDPYSALRYRGDSIPPIKTLAPEHVVYIGTFSKIFAPGLRIGFCVAPERLRKWLVIMKQGIDLHSSTFNQALAAEYLNGGFLKKHLPNIINLYRPRLGAMLAALDDCFPEEFEWSRPDGGMFVWCRGPQGLDMENVYRKSVARKAAFVPGRFFFSHKGDGLETMRLNFTMNKEEPISSAVQIIAEIIKEEIMKGRNWKGA